ncbi:MAG: LysE family transporter [Bacteroidetes bacterium]|nr:LysE family transporter [Bacteroidota bacterium]
MKDGLGFLVYLVPAITFGFAAAIQPGPLSLYLISQTLRNGWKRTMPAILSPLITDGPIAVVCLLVLSSLPHAFLRYLQMAGGLFILYLALNAFLAWKNFREQQVTTGVSPVKTLLNAVIVNFLNPGPYLGWSLVIGPLFLKGWKAHPGYGFAALAGFYVAMLLTNAAIILLFHLARERGPRLQRMLIGISALFLAVFGGFQIVTGFIL